MLALRTAPCAIRLILAALTLLVVLLRRTSWRSTSCRRPPGSSPEALRRNVVIHELRGPLRRARPPGPGRARGVAADGARPGDVGGSGCSYYTFVQWDLEEIPFPSLADALCLLFVPAHLRRAGPALPVEGPRPTATRCGSTAPSGRSRVGALGAAIVFDAVLESTGGAALTVATNLTYPLADLLVLGARGRRAGDDRLPQGRSLGLDRGRSRDLRRRGQPLPLRHRGRHLRGAA